MGSFIFIYKITYGRPKMLHDGWYPNGGVQLVVLWVNATLLFALMYTYQTL